MLELTMIQTRGFRNRAPGDGFTVRLRLPQYRGLWVNLINGATITVDGERFEADTIGWELDGTRYSLADLHDAETLRWPLDRAATLVVPRREPLTTGIHTVVADLQVRISYMPEDLDPTTWTEERKLVITQ